MGTTFALLIALVAYHDSGESSDKQALIAIRTAFAANRDALAETGSIRYVYADGIVPAGAASSPEELSKASWKRLSPIEGVYLFDGKLGLQKRLYPIEDLRERRTIIGDGSYQTPLSSFQGMTDGQVSLVDEQSVTPDGSNILHRAAISKSSEMFSKNIFVPLDLGCSVCGGMDQSLDFLIDRLPGWELLGIDENTRMDGFRTVKISLGNREKKIRSHYWVDLERGALPRLMVQELEGGAPTWCYWYGDIRRAGEKGWYPFHTLMFYGKIPVSGRCGELMAKEFVIKEADFDHKPVSKAFKIVLPGDQIVVNDTTRNMHEPRAVWDLAALRTARSEMERHPPLLEEDAPMPVMPGELTRKSSWSVPLIVFGVFCLLGSGFVYARLRRRSGHVRKKPD